MKQKEENRDKREIEVLDVEEKGQRKTKDKKKKKKEENRTQRNLQRKKPAGMEKKGFPKNKVDHQKWSASSDEKKRELGEAQKRGR